MVYRAVLFWFLGKPSSVYATYLASKPYTFYNVQEQHGHVYLVGLYFNFPNPLQESITTWTSCWWESTDKSPFGTHHSNSTNSTTQEAK